MFDFNFWETRVDYDNIFFFLNYKYKYINKKERLFKRVIYTDNEYKNTQTNQNKTKGSHLQ